MSELARLEAELQLVQARLAGANEQAATLRTTLRDLDNDARRIAAVLAAIEVPHA